MAGFNVGVWLHFLFAIGFANGLVTTKCENIIKLFPKAADLTKYRCLNENEILAYQPRPSDGKSNKESEDSLSRFTNTINSKYEEEIIDKKRLKRGALVENCNESEENYYPNYRLSEKLLSRPTTRFFRRPNIYNTGSYGPKPYYPQPYPVSPPRPTTSRYNNPNNDVYVLRPADYPENYVPVSRNNNPMVCGRNSRTARSQKIVGGTTVNLGEYPWMALMQYRGRTRIVNGCGATLISARFILTAAHCVDDQLLRQRQLRLLRIILGEHDTTTDVDCVTSPNRICADPPRFYTPARIIRHEQFDNVNAINDIALIELDREVIFSDYIKPICLPAKDFIYKEDDLVLVVGWGRVTTEGNYSPELLKATLPLVNKDLCNNRGVSLTEGQMCLGLGQGVDTCAGDSGGPMLMQRMENLEPVTFQVGIISYGFASVGCGTAPSVNTYLPYYLDWINSKINDN